MGNLPVVGRRTQKYLIPASHLHYSSGMGASGAAQYAGGLLKKRDGSVAQLSCGLRALGMSWQGGRAGMAGFSQCRHSAQGACNRWGTEEKLK